MPYMSVSAINACVDYITSTYAAIATPIALPENSVEGRPVKALKIAKGSGSNRTGVLLLGGTHARELVNPETVVTFALRLCDAYTNNTTLTFGPKVYDASTIQTLVNGLDIFLVPMVNPDGREFCLAPGGFAMWRKNRRPPIAGSCPSLPADRRGGVDLNRNYDFLWASGIGTSSSSCDDVYKGPSAFSEPETRNIRWMIDTHRNIATMIDIHSYSELVLFPWGDDNNQTTTPSQNFQNPAFNGQRGVPGSGYSEYIPQADLDAHVAAAERIRNGIAAVRGRTYTVQQSVLLYPTTGTTHDYAYARKFVDTGRRRILGFTLETAREFQPNDAEKDQVITEVSAGLIECLMETLCPAEAVQALLDALFPLHAMREFRDRHLLTSASGQRFEQLFRKHSFEVVRLVQLNDDALKAAAALMAVAERFLSDERGPSGRKIGTSDVAEATKALSALRKHGSAALKNSIRLVMAELKRSQGRTLVGAAKALGKTRRAARKKPKPSARKRRA
jgi:carboxypeptidase T